MSDVEIDVDKIIAVNHKLLLVLGYSVAYLDELTKSLPEDKKSGYHWVMQATESIVYTNQPFPPFPSKGS